MPLHRHTHHHPEDTVSVRPEFTRSGEVTSVPRNQMPAESMDPDVAYQIVHDELILDGSSRLNLATFVTTWMEPQAQRLIAETLDKNMIDKDEYPQTAELERRCVSMLADLWHAHGSESATGTSTVGSSEAAMLGGLALKWRWRQRREAAGEDATKPNLVMGVNVQVCWEKFARYWDVEPRYVPMERGRLHLTGPEAAALCDENTIGVVAVLGSTQDGSYEPVAEIAAELDRLQAEKGIDVPIHVDGASGAFVAPFIDPELEWDFRLPRVKSINASGHKYGLVYPGVGWVVWRDAESLPDELVFDVNYLGGDMPTFALNFSRPGAQVAAQYYNFLRLGKDGYRRILQAGRDTALDLSRRIAELGPFELLSDGSALPVFIFGLKDDVTNYTVYDVAAKLRERGWLVPAYSLPENVQDVHVIRVVLRVGFSRDLADLLVADLERAVRYFESLDGPVPHDPAHSATFHH